jgi:hypothetical protein
MEERDEQRKKGLDSVFIKKYLRLIVQAVVIIIMLYAAWQFFRVL